MPELRIIAVANGSGKSSLTKLSTISIPIIDPDELRPKEEKEFWFARDPITKFAKYLIAEGLFTQAELTALDQEIQDVIDDSVEFAENSPEPDPAELRRYIFAEG